MLGPFESSGSFECSGLSFELAAFHDRGLKDGVLHCVRVPGSAAIHDRELEDRKLHFLLRFLPLGMHRSESLDQQQSTTGSLRMENCITTGAARHAVTGDLRSDL
eukprot:1160859-Pelagomonas_calceolata.AAC.3